MQYTTARDLIREVSEDNLTIDRDKIFTLVCQYFDEKFDGDEVDIVTEQLGLTSTLKIREEISQYLAVESPKDSKYRVSSKSIRHIGKIIESIGKDVKREDMLQAVCQKLEARYKNTNYLEPALKKMKIPTTREVQYAINLYYAIDPPSNQAV